MSDIGELAAKHAPPAPLQAVSIADRITVPHLPESGTLELSLPQLSDTLEVTLGHLLPHRIPCRLLCTCCPALATGHLASSKLLQLRQLQRSSSHSAAEHMTAPLQPVPAAQHTATSAIGVLAA